MPRCALKSRTVPSSAATGHGTLDMASAPERLPGAVPLDGRSESSRRAAAAATPFPIMSPPTPTDRCVIFDMDGVLAQLDRQRRLEFLAAKLDLPSTHLQQQIWDSDFEVRAEAGAFVSGEGYLAEFNRRLDRNLSRTDWIEARRSAMTVNVPTLQLARRVAQRAPIAMLTNNGWLLKESLAQLVPDIVAAFG